MADQARLHPREEPGAKVESVYIPEEDRGTLCVSSQVGCTLTCAFSTRARNNLYAI